MGSSGTRKPSDAVRIKPVQQTKTAGNGGGAGASGSGGEKASDINNICPIRFQVKLVRQDIEPGTQLILDGSGLTVPGIGEVGKIGAHVKKRLETCSGLGISYTTIVTVIDQGTCYAEFSQ